MLPKPGACIWWDVFPIPTARAVFTGSGANTQVTLVPGYFKMRSRFVDFAGQYVLHCHILAHEDRGMMTMVEVVPFTTAVFARMSRQGATVARHVRPFADPCGAFHAEACLRRRRADASTVIARSPRARPRRSAARCSLRSMPRVRDCSISAPAPAGSAGRSSRRATTMSASTSRFGMLRAFRRARPARSARRAWCRRTGNVLPFRDATFDAVLLIQVFGGLRDWRPLLAEARRVLRPAGALILGRIGRAGRWRRRAHEAAARRCSSKRWAPRLRTSAREDAQRWLESTRVQTRHASIAATWTAARSAARLSRAPPHRRALLRLAGSRSRTRRWRRLAAWAEATFGSLDAASRERACVRAADLQVSRSGVAECRT